MIGSFIPYLFYHEGTWIKKLFSVESLIANSGNKWNEKRGYVKGAYNDEFDYVADDNSIISAAIEYISISDSKTINLNALNKALLQHSIPSI